MALRYRIDSLDGIDDNIKAMYKESGGAFILDVEGAKGEDDIKGLESALHKEREARKKFEKDIARYGGKTPEEVFAILDELEAAKAGGKFDIKNLPESEREELVKSVVDSRTRKYERQIEDIRKQLDDAIASKNAVESEYISTNLESFVRSRINGKVIPEAAEDAIFMAKSSLKWNPEDKAFYAEDGTAGDKYIDSMIERKKHWQLPTRGAGAKNGTSGTGKTGNPSMKDLITEVFTR